MTVVVTGASGFVGGHVVGALRAAGHAVRGLVRPSSNIRGLEVEGVASPPRSEKRVAAILRVLER